MKLANGVVAHVRMQRPRRKRCFVCAAPSAARLCDHEVSPGKTCDRALCAGCTYAPESWIDYCPEHRGAHGWVAA